VVSEAVTQRQGLKVGALLMYDISAGAGEHHVSGLCPNNVADIADGFLMA